MKLTIKDKCIFPYENKYEAYLTYKIGEFDSKNISLFYQDTEIKTFIIEAFIAKELSKYKNTGTFNPYDFLVRHNNVTQHFQWLKKANDKLNHYYHFDSYELFYYTNGEKYHVELSQIKEVLKKIKTLNKEYKIGGINTWYKATQQDYDKYHLAIKFLIEKCLIISEKNELESDLKKHKNPKAKKNNKVKL